MKSKEYDIRVDKQYTYRILKEKNSLRIRSHFHNKLTESKRSFSGSSDPR